jgi:hypothetical protein
VPVFSPLAAVALEPDSKLDPLLPVEPALPVDPVDPMPGHGCPERGPCPGTGAPCGVAELADGSAAVAVVCVFVVVPLVALGAAAAAAIPPIAPAEASVPVMTATFTALEGFIGMDLLGSVGGYADDARGAP